MLSAAFLLVALHVALAWSARAPGVLTGQDDAEYIALGQSIRQGGYNDLFRADAPVHTTYPPAYPVLLAVWGAAVGDDFDRLVALNILLSAASLLVLFLAVRDVAGAGIALACMALLAVNPVMLEFAGEIRAEPAYILFSLVSLGWLQRAGGRLRALGGAAGVAVLAALTRTVGATLLIAVIAGWVIEKRWRLVAGVLSFAAVAALGWLVWTSRSQDQFLGVSYLAELRALWRGSNVAPPLFPRMLAFARYYATDAIPWQLALPSRAGTVIDNVLGVLAMGLAIGAGAASLFSRWRPAVLYVVAYALLLLVWLYAVDRFALPIVPLLLVFALAGARAIGRRAGGRWGSIGAAALAVLLMAGAIPRTAALVRRNSPCHTTGPYPPAACMSPEQASYFDALRWIDANLPENAILLTSKPGALWLYTGRLSVSYDAAIRQDTADFLPWLRRNRAGWILLNKLHNREPSYLAPLLRADCRSLRLVAAFPPGSTLFAIEAAGEVSDAAACASLDDYGRDLGGLEVEGRIR